MQKQLLFVNDFLNFLVITYLLPLFRIYSLIHLLNLVTNILIVEENKPKKYKPIILKSCHKVMAAVLPVFVLH